MDTKLTNLVSHINGMSPAINFVVDIGDVSQTGYLLECQTIKTILDGLNCPWYPTAGNHEGYNTPPKFEHYDSVFGARHVSIDGGTYQLILMFAYPSYDLTPEGMYGYLDAAELAWIEQECIAAGEKTILMGCHYPADDPVNGYEITTGNADLLTLCDTYGVKMFFGGHVHSVNISAISGMENIIGPAFKENGAVAGGYLVCNVYANRIEYECFDAETHARLTGTYPRTIWL